MSNAFGLLLDNDSGGSSATAGNSGVETSPGVDEGAGDGGGTTSGGAEDGTPSGTPDPTAAAFDVIEPGDCLALWDTGYRGDTIAWSSEVPPKPLPGCAHQDALVRVSGVGGTVTDCPTGYGRSYWSYLSPVDHNNRVLCLTRLYHEGSCLLGSQEGEGDSARISIGPMTAVDCEADRVPVSYDRIMQITGVYKVPADVASDVCRQGPGDRRSYWAWRVYDGDVLLCATLYQG